MGEDGHISLLEKEVNLLKQQNAQLYSLLELSRQANDLRDERIEELQATIRNMMSEKPPMQ